MTVIEQTQIEPITLTPQAAGAVRDLLTNRNLQGYALRIYVQGGGCSGIQIGLALDSNIRPTDSVSETEGVKLIIDEVSIQYLHGSTVDYLENESGSGFKILSPNPFPSCACSQDQSSEAGCSGCN